MIVAVIFILIEYHQHQKRVHSIPVRIHVNGTRGKSSVARLIGEGLRAGGFSTITKITGTYPRLVLEDRRETVIHRKAGANIIEQLSIVKFAAKRKVDALVMECMALQPQYQWITEHQMIHSNLSVMTNVRLDHVDIMGYTLPEIANVLGLTIPKNEHLFTAENVVPEMLQEIADKLNTKTHFCETNDVKQAEMKGFKYIEHRENVALALSVCQHLNIDREVALEGMYRTNPDSGALMCNRVDVYQKKIHFYNAFAANDPDSSLMVWRMIRDEIGLAGQTAILLNTRQDRLDRAKQLAQMCATRLEKEMEYLVLIGESTDVVENLSIRYGFPKKKIIRLGWTTPENVFEKFLSITKEEITILAIGNMGGMGAATAKYFENRSTA